MTTRDKIRNKEIRRRREIAREVQGYIEEERLIRFGHTETKIDESNG